MPMLQVEVGCPWVAATAKTPQGGRTPTGLPTSNPATCPQGKNSTPFQDSTSHGELIKVSPKGKCFDL